METSKCNFRPAALQGEKRRKPTSIAYIYHQGIIKEVLGRLRKVIKQV